MQVTRKVVTTVVLERGDIAPIRRALLMYITDLYGDKGVPAESTLGQLYDALDDGTNIGKLPALKRETGVNLAERATDVLAFKS